MLSPESRRINLDSPVTLEMIDTGLILKRSFELTSTIAETWVSVFVAKIVGDHVMPIEERMQT